MAVAFPFAHTVALFLFNVWLAKAMGLHSCIRTAPNPCCNTSLCTIMSLLLSKYGSTGAVVSAVLICSRNVLVLCAIATLRFHVLVAQVAHLTLKEME